ncbi:MAG: TonB-dependent receptor plug domain-containing protein [Gemmatimonadaceae bacterium]|nr:TonB-dependent receptor plug domain-containing protein [Gemmatimonadaceae bacterium]
MRTPSVLPQAAIAVTTAIALLALPAPALSQGSSTLRGTVLTEMGTTLSGAQLRFSAPLRNVNAAESDDAGVFTFAGLPQGQVWLYARRIGFRPDSVLLTMPASGELRTTVTLQRLPQQLGAVQVNGRRELTGSMAGFYRRMGQGIGGRYFTLAEIERRNASNMTDLLRTLPGVRIESRGMINYVRIRNSRCAPLVWLDGQPLFAAEVDLDAFDPRSFEGIEVYSGAASVPVEFMGNQRMSSACGTIVLWSRHGEPRPKKPKKNDPTPTERIAKMLEEGKAHVHTEVDRGAFPDSGMLVRPVYPDSLFEEIVGGRVIAEFVVDTNGRAIMDTFSAITYTHRMFVEPVRRAVREQQFQPAVRKGGFVMQVLHLPFDFIPDSTARRRE